MDEPEHCQTSQDLDELLGLSQERRTFPGMYGFFSKRRQSTAASEQMKILRAWCTLATVFAVFAACVSVTIPMRSQAQLVWAVASVVEVEASERRSIDNLSGSTEAQAPLSPFSSHNHQAIEAESDGQDVDCGVIAVRTSRILSIPALQEQRLAPRADWLMTPTHLCVSSTFPRGPPTVS